METPEHNLRVTAFQRPCFCRAANLAERLIGVEMKKQGKEKKPISIG